MELKVFNTLFELYQSSNNRETKDILKSSMTYLRINSLTNEQLYECIKQVSQTDTNDLIIFNRMTDSFRKLPDTDEEKYDIGKLLDRFRKYDFPNESLHDCFVKYIRIMNI